MSDSENTPLPTAAEDGRMSFVVCRNSQGVEVRGTLHRLSRYMAVFEVYNPYSIVQLSEVLRDFRIMMNDRVIYSGRATIANLVNTGIMLICEASLTDEGWLDVDIFSPHTQKRRVQTELREFLVESEKIHQVIADVKVVVADIQTMLGDLRRWMEQVELSVRSLPAENRVEAEREVILEMEKPILPSLWPLFYQFEEAATKIPEGLHAVHRNYIRRQLHPTVLCSPFTYRTYQKPLGYAGDYEMVSMMLRDPYEGSSVFAKVLNRVFLESPTVVAHRNRIDYLTEMLVEETTRVAAEGRVARIFNLGCGPAQEIQRFISTQSISDEADFLLLDFNDETIAHTTRALEELRAKHRRRTVLTFDAKSVHHVLREYGRLGEHDRTRTFDVVYCAGLFDYLSDRICRKLIEIFYDLVAPGGLLVATNVHSSNPSREWMESVMDWHLVYRDNQQFLALAPAEAPEGASVLRADPTGVNIFLEVRRPADA